MSIKAPKCAKTAKVNVTVYGKPAKGSGVNGLFLLKKYPPGPPSDAYKYQYYAVPASGPLPFVTGKTQSMSAMVPVGVRVYGVAIFGIAGSGATALPEKKAFMVQKCKPRKKPHYTG